MFRKVTGSMIANQHLSFGTLMSERIQQKKKLFRSLLQSGVCRFAALKAFDLLIFIGVLCSFKEATGSEQRVKRGEGMVDFHTANAKWQTGYNEGI